MRWRGYRRSTSEPPPLEPGLLRGYTVLHRWRAARVLGALCRLLA